MYPLLARYRVYRAQTELEQCWCGAALACRTGLMLQTEVIEESDSADGFMHLDGLGRHLKVGVVGDFEFLQLQKVNRLEQDVQAVLERKT